MEMFLPCVKTPQSKSRIPILFPRESVSSIYHGSIISWNHSFHSSIDLEVRRLVLHNSFSDGVSIAQQQQQECPESLPLTVELEPVSSEAQFDRVLGEAQLLDESVVVLWMANWCRKCIYLKPKLEKLAADYYPRIRFYAIDVNNVPHKLVVRAGVTKMPTIQLWRDGEKQSEVIGGHKAYLVVNEVRQMIENEDSIL